MNWQLMQICEMHLTFVLFMLLYPVEDLQLDYNKF